MPVAQVVDAVPSPSIHAPAAASSKFGLSLASLIVGIVVSLFALADLGMVGSGDYGYIYYSEVGWIFIGALTSLGLAIPAMVKRERIRVAALIVSIVAVLLALAIAPYGG